MCMGKILVVAGTHAQAEYYAQDTGMAKGDWVYAGSADSLRGWLPTRVVYYGTYAQRADWFHLEEELMVVEARMKYAIKEATCCACGPASHKPNLDGTRLFCLDCDCAAAAAK